MRFLTSLFCFFTCCHCYAGRVSGTVTDNQGKILSYASILIKGSTKGASTNIEGKYFLDLQPGTYTLMCQYVGFKREEKTITVGAENMVVDFQLSIQEFTMSEVVIREGEDPAYAIIRSAIKKRPFYKDQVKEFQCEVYTKGQLKLRDFPKKFFGEKVDFEDGDTSKKKMLYLSETVARYSVGGHDKSKIEVISTKVSGQSDGFGLSAPQILSFYDNNINIGSGLNPRGFISPISANALNYYRYKFEGSFYEDGKEISRIKVIPKRKYEPLFSGYINIVDEEWRIHSLQLQLTRESQMEIIDTMRIEQLYVPFTKDVWVVKSQVLYPAIKMFGFDAYGSFVNIYSKFDIEPLFAKNLFNNTVLKYEDSSNKKSLEYWNVVRPVPLQNDETADYKKKDSLELVRKDPRYMDSLDRGRNKFKPFNFILFGQSFSKQKSRSSVSLPSLLEMVKYNTVEGLVVNPEVTYFMRIDTGNGRKAFSFTPNLRYGFSNHHFNAYGIFNYTYGKKYAGAFNIAGGKRVFQFNNASAQGERGGTLSALVYKNNRRKIYEAWYTRVRFQKSLGEGFSGNISLQYQDRMPLDNTTDYTWSNKKKSFTPNYPEQFIGPAFVRHQALIANINVNWRPGSRYIEFPDRKINIGSKYPTFFLSYTKGLKNMLGSDVDYDKWRFGISDDLNFKLAGQFSYRVSTGGFLNSRKVQIPDYFHLNGNLSTLAADYLGSFQLLPHYKYSNTEKLFTTAFVEHHFNGFLTNKIPAFRRLNWHLVAGANAFYGNKDLRYLEVFAGIENIFKLIRVDFVQGYFNGRTATSGIRIGIKGFTGGKVED